MSLAAITNASLWANQISALSAQGAVKPIAVVAPGAAPSGATAIGASAGRFADLIATLTTPVAANSAAAGTINAGASGSTSGGSGAVASRSQIALDLQAFTQSLFQALASNQSMQGGSTGNAVNPGSTTSPANTTGPGSNGSAAAGVSMHRYGHGHGGMHSRLESLINTLNSTASTNASTGTSSAPTSGSVANLNASFKKLMADLGISNPATASTSNVPSSQSSSATLQSLLQQMQQHLQQQGAWGASVGHVVHVVA
jgi:hypothetical protein